MDNKCEHINTLKRVFSKEYDWLYQCTECNDCIVMEKVDYKKFTLEDFKTGMVVKLRNGQLYRVMLGTDKGNLLINKHGGLTLFGGILHDNKMDGYDENLCHYCLEEEEDWKKLRRQYDIMEIWKPKDGLWGLTKMNLKFMKCIFKR